MKKLELKNLNVKSLSQNKQKSVQGGCSQLTKIIVKGVCKLPAKKGKKLIRSNGIQ